MRFVDTSFWVAMRFRRDAHYDEARRLWADRGQRLLTSNLVLGETGTFLRRRLGHTEAQDFVDRARRSPRLTVDRVDDLEESQAWAWLSRHDERPYSFVDATSFALMRQLKVTQALAFDDDFAAAGFTEVRP